MAVALILTGWWMYIDVPQTPQAVVVCVIVFNAAFGYRCGFIFSFSSCNLPGNLAGDLFHGFIPLRHVMVFFIFFGTPILKPNLDHAPHSSSKGCFVIYSYELGLQFPCWPNDAHSTGYHCLASVSFTRLLLRLQLHTRYVTVFGEKYKKLAFIDWIAVYFRELQILSLSCWRRIRVLQCIPRRRASRWKKWMQSLEKVCERNACICSNVTFLQRSDSILRTMMREKLRSVQHLPGLCYRATWRLQTTTRVNLLQHLVQPLDGSDANSPDGEETAMRTRARPNFQVPSMTQAWRNRIAWTFIRVINSPNLSSMP